MPTAPGLPSGITCRKEKDSSLLSGTALCPGLSDACPSELVPRVGQAGNYLGQQSDCGLTACFIGASRALEQQVGVVLLLWREEFAWRTGKSHLAVSTFPSGCRKLVSLPLTASMQTEQASLCCPQPYALKAPTLPFASSAEKPWVTAACHNYQASVTTLLYHYKQCVLIHWREGGLCQIEASFTCLEASGVSVSATGRQLPCCFQGATLEFNTFPWASAVKQCIASVPWTRDLVKSTVWWCWVRDEVTPGDFQCFAGQPSILLCPEGPQMSRSFWWVTCTYKHDTVFAPLHSWWRALCTGRGRWWGITMQGSASAFPFQFQHHWAGK